MFTIAGAAVPLFGWWISGPVMAGCAGIAIWGFWPLIRSLVVRRGSMTLRRAAEFAFERARRAGLEGVAYGRQQDRAHRLQQIMNTISASGKVRLYGRHISETRVVPIPLEENPSATLGGDLADDLGQPIYTDVTVNLLDLWKFLRRLGQ